VSHPDGSIVRVLGRAGATAGVGVLIGTHEILTCAHVVNAALGRDLGSRAVPADLIEVRFPLIGVPWSLQARVAQWFAPVPDGDVDDDLAILVLEGAVPQGATPARVATDASMTGRGADVFGYPGQPPRPDGGWVPVTVRGVVGGGRLQLDARDSAALRVQPGFSGSPVIDADTGDVLGVLVTAPPARSGGLDSYAIPASRVHTLRGDGADPPPWYGLAPYVHVALAGHAGAVNAVRFSPDLTMLATAGADGRILLWDTTACAITAELRNPVPVTALAFRGDGLLAAGGPDGSAALWDVENSKITGTLAHAAAVTAMTFHRTTGRLATGTADGTMTVWDEITRAPIITRSHTGPVTAVGFSVPDGMIVARDTAGTVNMWESPDYDDPNTLTNPSPEWPIARSGGLFAGGGADGVVRLWHVDMPESGITWWAEFSATLGALILCSDDHGRYLARRAESPALVATLPAHAGPVNTVSFSLDGTMLASGGADGRVGLWAFARGPAMPVVLGGHTGAVQAIAFSADSTTLATASADRTIRLWDVPARANTDVLIGHDDAVHSVSFLWGGVSLISGGADRDVRLWNLAVRGRSNTIGVPADVWALAFGPDPNGGTESSVGTLPGSMAGRRSIAFAPDGKTCAFITDDNRIVLLDFTTGGSGVIPDAGDRIRSVAFRPDGQRIVVSEADGSYQTWTIAAGPDGTGPDRGKALWETDGGASVAFFPRSQNSVAFSPDGTIVATGAEDGTVRLVEAATGAVVAAHTGHSGAVLTVAFSPDGTVLASGGEDHSVRLWELPRLTG
jgi:WD40 repeat protein